MKEPVLLIRLHYLPAALDTGHIKIDYESIRDHSKQLYLKYPADWVADPGQQTSHPKVIETDQTKFIANVGYPCKDILHRDDSTKFFQDKSEAKRKESADNCVSMHVSDSVNTEQLNHKCIEQQDIVEQCAGGMCNPHSNLVHEGVKLQRFSGNLSCSNLDHNDVHNEETSVHPLNFHMNNTSKTKHGPHQVIIAEDYSLQQVTQIIQCRSFHEVNSSDSSKHPNEKLTIGNRIQSFTNKENVNESLGDRVVSLSQQPLNCHVSPNKKSFLPQADNILLGDRQLDKLNNLYKECVAVEQDPRNKTEIPCQERNIGNVSKKKEMRPRQSFLTKYLSCRWKLAYLCFLARFIQTSLRQCMGIAIIGMTMKVSAGDTRNTTNASCNFSQSEVPQMVQEFHWSSVFEGVILASFNVGSIVTPVIVGYVTSRHGGRTLMSACLLVGGTFTVLLPLAAKADPVFIIVFRIITGIALSGTDSLIQGMWSKWAPLYERASLSACAYSGLSVAGVLTFLVCGYIVSIGGEGQGWPYIFYIFGSTCFLLAPVWYLTVYDEPEDHPLITKQELAIITFSKRPEHPLHYKKALNIPWRRICLSSAAWVIVMGHITHKWILTFMLSYLPRYFSDLFDFGMKMDGVFSSLPFIGRVISGVIAGYVSDWMLRRGVSTARTRKSFQAIGCWGCAVFSLIIAFVPDLSTVWSVLLLVLALSWQDLTSVAFRINLLDIAPRYAGVLNGVASTIATVTSLPAPIITSLLISGGSRQGWQVLFCLVAVLNTIGGALFVIFAKGEIQDWAQSTHPNDNANGDNGLMVFTLDVSSDKKPTEFSRDKTPTEFSRDKTPTEFNIVKRKSLPANLHHPRKHLSAIVVRRATLDCGSVVKNLQNHSFSNLALADL